MNNLRVAKTDKSDAPTSMDGKIRFVYDGDNILFEGSTFYLNNIMVNSYEAEIQELRTVTYLKDAIGSIRAEVYDRAITVPEIKTEPFSYRTFEYTAFGESLDSSTSLTGTSAREPKSGSETKEGIGFTGHYFDKESGLYYARARYYNPETGRFISSDPIRDAEKRYSPAGLNRYIYGLNNPLKYWDPDGKWINTVFGFLIGAIIGGVQAALSGGNFADIFLGALSGGVSGALVANCVMVNISLSTHGFSVGVGIGNMASVGMSVGFDDGGSFGLNARVGFGNQNGLGAGFEAGVNFSGRGVEGNLGGFASLGKFSIGGGIRGSTSGDPDDNGFYAKAQGGIGGGEGNFGAYGGGQLNFNSSFTPTGGNIFGGVTYTPQGDVNSAPSFYTYGAGVNAENKDGAWKWSSTVSANFDNQRYLNAVTEAEYEKAGRGLSIIKNKDSRTYITHGTTNIGSSEKITDPDTLNEINLGQDKVFLTENGIQDSEQGTDEIGQIFGSTKKNSFYLRWTGENLDESRTTATKKISDDIRQQAREYYRKTGQKMHINLVGHSHGGNVMILVANRLKEMGAPVEIDNVLTLSSPVRPEYQLKDTSINHIQLYNQNDFVQNIGYIDADKYVKMGLFLASTGFATLPLVAREIGSFMEPHRFNDAYNLNTGPYLRDSDLDPWRDDNPLHQSTRSVRLIKDVLSPYMH